MKKLNADNETLIWLELPFELTLEDRLRSFDVRCSLYPMVINVLYIHQNQTLPTRKTKIYVLYSHARLNFCLSVEIM